MTAGGRGACERARRPEPQNRRRSGSTPLAFERGLWGFDASDELSVSPKPAQSRTAVVTQPGQGGDPASASAVSGPPRQSSARGPCFDSGHGPDAPEGDQRAVDDPVPGPHGADDVIGLGDRSDLEQASRCFHRGLYVVQHVKEILEPNREASRRRAVSDEVDFEGRHERALPQPRASTAGRSRQGGRGRDGADSRGWRSLDRPKTRWSFIRHPHRVRGTAAAREWRRRGPRRSWGPRSPTRLGEGTVVACEVRSSSARPARRTSTRPLVGQWRVHRRGSRRFGTVN